MSYDFKGSSRNYSRYSKYPRKTKHSSVNDWNVKKSSLNGPWSKRKGSIKYDYNYGSVLSFLLNNVGRPYNKILSELTLLFKEQGIITVTAKKKAIDDFLSYRFVPKGPHKILNESANYSYHPKEEISGTKLERRVI